MTHSFEECNLQAPRWLGLMAGSQRDREKAARHLFDCYYRWMVGFVIRKFHLDAVTAEEIGQEAMIKGLKGAGRFEGRSQVSTWFMKIAIREVFNHFRDIKSHPDQPDQYRDDPFAVVSGEVDSSHEYLVRSANRPVDSGLVTSGEPGGEEVFQKCYDRQFARFYQDNPECGDMISRFYLEGWSSKGLAADLDKPEATIRKRLEACRKVLREYLVECRELWHG